MMVVMTTTKHKFYIYIYIYMDVLSGHMEDMIIPVPVR